MNNTIKKETLLLIAMMLISFAFSVAVRYIWIYQFSGVEAFKYAGEFMINTNDGYFFAEGARDLLNGFHQKNDLSPVDYAVSQLTYILAKILPISFETLILYMPAFLSSLLVVPLILIAHNFKMIEVGFLAALLGSIAMSYYNRTMVGYYDTDMLVIVFPTFLLWSLILAIRTKEEKYLLFTGLEMVAYRWWYPQSYSLEFVFIGLILAYCLIFERKNRFCYELIAIMLFAMMGLPNLVRLGAVICIYFIFRQERLQKYLFHILALGVVLFFATGGFSMIWGSLKGYVFKSAVEASKEILPLHFYSVVQTVREAGQIDFILFAERISGHIVTFLLSIAGYALMARRHPIVLIGLPLWGLGFLALWGGLRFTIYAVPVAALGVAYLLYVSSIYISTLFINKTLGSALKSAFVVISALGIIYPNIIHVINYRVPTVFNKVEVETLVKLGKIADREDYVVAWWDYGYPIRYYSDVKTLIDGGKHSGDVNYPVSYILTNPQEKAAKMARLEVEYTEKAFALAEENETAQSGISKFLPFAKNVNTILNNTAQMTLDYGFKDANDFLTSLETQMSLPPKTRDIYFYLPWRMMGIFPTVAQFSNIDIMSGKINREPFIFQTNQFKDSGSMVDLGSGVVFDKTKGVVKIGQQELKIKNFVHTAYSDKSEFIKKENVLHGDGKINLIYMQAYNNFLVLDEAMFNSTYIQLFVLENFDSKFFEKVSFDPYSKVYRLKI